MRLCLSKNLIVLFLFAFISLIFASEQSKFNGIEPNLKIEKQKRIWGIIVGISKYQNVSSLYNAHSDAISFYNYLLSPSNGKVDSNDIKLLLDLNATSYNIIRAFQFIKSKIKENDIVYFYFAGHGDVENITDSEMGYLICYSSPINIYASGGCLPIDYLQECLKSFANKKAKVIKIVDACRAGKLAGGKEGIKQTAIALQNEWEGITKILSCKPGEYSQEGLKWGGGAGVFTYYLIRGLKGYASKDINSKKISLLQLYNYLKENVSNDTDNKQNPKYSGDEDFVLSSIDKNVYLSMLDGKQLNDNSNLRGNIGFEPDISSIKDKYVKSQYYLFQHYIESNKLISYSDSENDSLNALYIFQSMKLNENAEPLIYVMKEALLAALQNKAQVISNNCLNNKWDFGDRIQVYKELETALNLIDSSYFFYKHIKANYLLWKGINKVILGGDTINIELMKECLSLESDNPLSYFLIAFVYSQMNQYELSLSNYDKALKLSPNWIMALNNKGGVLESLNKFEEAIIYYDKAIELDSNESGGYFSKGSALDGLSRYKEAIIYYDKALEINPNFSYAWKNKAKSYEKLGNLNNAKECIGEFFKCIEKEIELKPKDAELWYNAACNYSLMKNKMDMLVKLKRAIELDIKYREMAKKDNDFKEYLNDFDFQQLLR